MDLAAGKKGPINGVNYCGGFETGCNGCFKCMDKSRSSLSLLTVSIPSPFAQYSASNWGQDNVFCGSVLPGIGTCRQPRATFVPKENRYVCPSCGQGYGPVVEMHVPAHGKDGHLQYLVPSQIPSVKRAMEAQHRGAPSEEASARVNAAKETLIRFTTQQRIQAAQDEVIGSPKTTRSNIQSPRPSPPSVKPTPIRITRPKTEQRKPPKPEPVATQQKKMSHSHLLLKKMVTHPAVIRLFDEWTSKMSFNERADDSVEYQTEITPKGNKKKKKTKVTKPVKKRKVVTPTPKSPAKRKKVADTSDRLQMVAEFVKDVIDTRIGGITNITQLEPVDHALWRSTATTWVTEFVMNAADHSLKYGTVFDSKESFQAAGGTLVVMSDEIIYLCFLALLNSGCAITFTDFKKLLCPIPELDPNTKKKWSDAFQFIQRSVQLGKIRLFSSPYECSLIRLYVKRIVRPFVAFGCCLGKVECSEIESHYESINVIASPILDSIEREAKSLNKVRAWGNRAIQFLVRSFAGPAVVVLIESINRYNKTNKGHHAIARITASGAHETLPPASLKATTRALRHHFTNLPPAKQEEEEQEQDQES